jgi:hypothetical protein
MILNGFFSGRKHFFPIAGTVSPQIENKQVVGAKKSRRGTMVTPWPVSAYRPGVPGPRCPAPGPRPYDFLVLTSDATIAGSPYRLMKPVASAWS